MWTQFAVLLVMTSLLTPTAFQQTNDPAPAAEATEAVVDPDDTDGDGVLNIDDLCEGAISGATGTDETGCPTEFDPYVDLEYDHEPHELWYGRFWTGSCQGVPGFCLGGDPAWFDVTEEIVAQVPAAEQGVLRNRLWAAGRTIGYEWSSDPALNDKQIFTRQLRRWGNALQRGDDVVAELEAIENEVCDLLGADAFEGGFSTAENCQPDPAGEA
jgi:hypothetical protein